MTHSYAVIVVLWRCERCRRLRIIDAAVAGFYGVRNRCLIDSAIMSGANGTLFALPMQCRKFELIMHIYGLIQ